MEKIYAYEKIMKLNIYFIPLTKKEINVRTEATTLRSIGEILITLAQATNFRI